MKNKNNYWIYKSTKKAQSIEHQNKVRTKSNDLNITKPKRKYK